MYLPKHPLFAQWLFRHGIVRSLWLDGMEQALRLKRVEGGNKPRLKNVYLALRRQHTTQ